MTRKPLKRFAYLFGRERVPRLQSKVEEAEYELCQRYYAVPTPWRLQVHNSQSGTRHSRVWIPAHGHAGAFVMMDNVRTPVTLKKAA